MERLYSFSFFFLLGFLLVGVTYFSLLQLIVSKQDSWPSKVNMIKAEKSCNYNKNVAWQTISGQNYSSVYTLHIKLKSLEMRELMPFPQIFKVLIFYILPWISEEMRRKENSPVILCRISVPEMWKGILLEAGCVIQFQRNFYCTIFKILYS